MESSDPSRRPVPGSGGYKLHDYIRKHIDDTLGVTHLETPST